MTMSAEIYVVNHTDMAGEITLRELNDEEAKQYICAAVLIGILMIIGIIGNLHVLYVYTLKMKPSNLRVFMLCLTFVDMLTCSIAMPCVLYHLTHPLTFSSPFVCKTFRFVNFFNSIASAFILVLVSVERYRKICIPLGKQFTERSSRVCCGLVIIFALLISCPAPVLFGLTTVETISMHINGSRCLVDDRFKDTPYVGYFYICLILLFVITSLVLIVLYTLIGRQVRHHVLRTKFMTNMRNKEKFGNSEEVIDKEEEVLLKMSRPHPLIIRETDSDTGIQSADVTNISELRVHSKQRVIDELKRNKLKCFETKTDGNETYRCVSEIQESNISRQGDETSDFHCENMIGTEVKLKSDEVETKMYFSIRKYSQNMNDSPSVHIKGERDTAVTEYETSNNGTYNYMDSNICNTGIVLSTNLVNTGDCMTCSAFHTTCRTSDAPSSQETKKPTLNNSGSLFKVPKTFISDGVTMQMQEKRGANEAISYFYSTEKDTDKTRRITFILFLVTFVYFCSFLPHLILTTIIFLKTDFLSSLHFYERVAYNTFIWSFFVNNVANPFIYGFFDKNFKREVQLIYHRVCLICQNSGNNNYIS